MKKLFFSSMLLGGLMMASCSEDVMEAPKQEEVQKTYAQKFTEKFGPIAADQDWNLAEGKSINVNGASRAAGDALKIYAKYQGVYRLVAHFDDASQASYDFTTPADADKFIVTCGNEIQMVENGGTVDFAELSRTYAAEVDKVWEKHDGYTKFRKKDLVDSWSQLGGKNDNYGKGNLIDFKFYRNTTENGKDGVVSVYPAYWDGREAYQNMYHELGIYYYNVDGEKVHVPVYTSKQGDDLKENGVIIKNNNLWDPTDNNKNYTIESRGFDVTLLDYAFGFYVDVYKDGVKTNRWYGVAADNEEGRGVQMKLNKVSQLKLDNKSWYMLCIEAEINDGPDAEAFKDLFFWVGVSNNTQVITEEPQAYVLAVEDLGIDDDYDFNDIVFSISHVTGRPQATIKALAAGGTLPAQLYRGTEKIGSEFHSWFGASSSEMINTTSGEWVEGKEITIAVPVDFTMATNAPESMMGGFKVVVTKEGEQVSVAAPGLGSAPQMICVPAEWMWMEERDEIYKAYPMFGKYGQGYITTDWLNDENINTSYLYDANNAK